ncbi:eCIS core domain-containing protein [Natrinema pallidum]
MSGQTVSTTGAAVDALIQRVPQAAAPQDPGLGPLASARAEAVRERIEERPAAVPDDNSRQNLASLQRSTQAQHDTGSAGDTGVPDSVREVLSSPGRSLNASIQQAIEERMGDSLGDVQIHTGPKAAEACQEINARAFTVGNHIAFNAGEYDPSSPEGQHVLAHELAHVRQQTGGAISMLPQEGLELEIDPDPQLEREAEKTAQKVMTGDEWGIQRLAQTAVHIQRIDKTRRDLLTGDVSLNEVETGLEEAELNSVDTDIDSDRLRDAYKYAEYAVSAGATTGIAQTLSTKFSLSQPEAIAVSLAVGGTIHVGKDRIHRNDYYIIYEVGKRLGIEDRVLAFFEQMGIDLPVGTDTEAGEGGQV